MFLYLDYRVPPGAKIANTRDSRALVAKALDGHHNLPLLRTLMHQDNQGRQISSLSPVRFGAANRGHALRICAVGADACTVILRSSHEIALALSAHFGSNVAETRSMGNCMVAEATRIVGYRAPYFVFQRGRLTNELEAAAKGNQLDHAGMIDIIKDQLIRGLQRQADLLGCDLPEAIVEPRPNRLLPVNVKGNRFLLMVDVSFRSNLELKGPWHVGRLCGRGYGLIHPERKFRASFAPC